MFGAMETRGKVAVVTGASRGLGAGMAHSFAAAGLRLGLCSRSTPVLGESPDVTVAELDVTDEAAVDDFCARVHAKLGPIDLWVNNAGVLEPIAPLRDVASADYRRALEVNVMGVFHGSRAFARHRRGVDGGGGVLVNISSGAARNGYAGWSAYCASKAAVDLMTECIQLEEPGLRAYAVAPGVIDTDMQALIRGTSADRFPMVDKFLEMKKNDGFSSPEWVATRVLELAFGKDEPPSDVRIGFPGEK